MTARSARRALVRFLAALALLVFAMGLACGINPIPTPGACGSDSGGAEGGADAGYPWPDAVPRGDIVIPAEDTGSGPADALAPMDGTALDVPADVPGDAPDAPSSDGDDVPSADPEVSP